MPRLARLGFDDIVLNSCITSVNVNEIVALAGKARDWGVNICYSAYSPKRTGDRSYCLTSAEQLRALNEGLDMIEMMRDETNWIVNSSSTLLATRRYFADGGAPGCRAGLRFLVVRADGRLQPCSMQDRQFPLEKREDMIRQFTAQNECGECYVSIRSYLDKSFTQLLGENVAGFLSLDAHRPR